MTLPTDPLGIAIFVIDIILQGISFDEAVQRLRTGISATAEKEGRDITDHELALIKGLAEEQARRRRGQ